MGAMTMSTFSGDRTLAQSSIIADDTLGAETSLVIENFNGLPIELITGGAVRGQNLFHSFEEFNVSEGRGAYFSSPADIQNILARVTGSNRSEILGTLGTFGNSTPNLFLINPNGIIFGANAKLDVGGSFVATTANAVRLGETGLFSASKPETSTLLAINPNAFFFNQLANQAKIVNRSTATTPVLGYSLNGLPPRDGLHVPQGRSLLLLGGDVRLEGGVLQALGGRVELGGLSAPGTVKLNGNGEGLSLGFPEEVMLSDVSLTNRARVFASAGGDGSMAINAQTVELLGESMIVAGDIFIQASQNLELNRSEIDGTKVSGDGGDITLRVGNVLLMRNYSNISTTSKRYGAGGDGGKITITADFIVAVPVEDSDIIANAFNGRGGNINITTQGIYGLKFRKERTPLSDITASAQFGVDGELQLDLLTNLDPTQGLATLPTNVVDPSQQIAQSCTPAGERTSGFVATGRGGLPLSPDEPLRGWAIVTPTWVTLDEKVQTSANSRQVRGDGEMDAASSSPTEIVEADGWVVDAKGNVTLVAHSQSPNSVHSSIPPAFCPD